MSVPRRWRSRERAERRDLPSVGHSRWVPETPAPRTDEPGDDVLVVTRSLRIPLSELEWKFTASGGPGGQHANRSNTRAEVRFDVAASPSLLDVHRERLLERLGPVVRVVADDERSQLRNRDLALERLRGRLAEALRVERT